MQPPGRGELAGCRGPNFPPMNRGPFRTGVRLPFPARTYRPAEDCTLPGQSKEGRQLVSCAHSSAAPRGPCF
jgi:hypothetical protein